MTTTMIDSCYFCCYRCCRILFLSVVVLVVLVVFVIQTGETLFLWNDDGLPCKDQIKTPAQVSGPCSEEKEIRGEKEY